MNRLPVTIALLGFGLFASTLGIWFVRADDAKPAAATKVKTLAETTAILQKPCGIENTDLGNVSIDELFQQLGLKHDVVFRLDPAVFSKANGFTNMMERRGPAVRLTGLTVQDLLVCLCEELGDEGRKYGIHAKAGQILITQRFQPATTPGRYKTNEPMPMISEDQIAHLLYGPTVSIASNDKSLADVVALLREQTGANIIIDPRCGNLGERPLTMTFNDAKLRTVLKLAADLCDLGVAVVDNAFVISEPSHAASLMHETELNLFGHPQPKAAKAAK